MANPPESSEFSFDLYPGLDAELEAAYRRNISEGNASAEEVATAGLGVAVSEALQQHRLDTLLAPEIQYWAEQELTDAMSGWANYPRHLIGSIPGFDPDKAYSLDPELDSTMQSLYEAKQTLTNSTDTNPEGINIGETMHLTLIPWYQIRDYQGNFDVWVQQLRDAQGIATNDEFFNDNLLYAIKNDKPLYRDPDNPSTLLKPSKYLDKKIAQDGPWGIMLTQTSDEAGIDRLIGHSPDQMTAWGSTHLDVEGINVDNMGFFEWISLSLQEDPRELSPTDYSWLLANHMSVDDIPRVPGARWDGSRVGSFLFTAGRHDDRSRPRLAVISGPNDREMSA